MNIRPDEILQPAQGFSYGEQLYKVISALEIQPFFMLCPILKAVY